MAELAAPNNSERKELWLENLQSPWSTPSLRPEWESYIDRRSYPSHDEIAKLAYSLYEARGRQEGHQLDDWLRAEQEFVRHYA